MSTSPKNAPDEAETVRVEFKQGVPVKITNLTDGTVKENPLDLFLYCNFIAGKHGIGRIDIVKIDSSALNLEAYTKRLEGRSYVLAIWIWRVSVWTVR